MTNAASRNVGRWCSRCGGGMEHAAYNLVVDRTRLPLRFGSVVDERVGAYCVECGAFEDGEVTDEDRERWRREADEAKEWRRKVKAGQGGVLVAPNVEGYEAEPESEAEEPDTGPLVGQLGMGLG